MVIDKESVNGFSSPNQQCGDKDLSLCGGVALQLQQILSTRVNQEPVLRLTSNCLLTVQMVQGTLH